MSISQSVSTRNLERLSLDVTKEAGIVAPVKAADRTLMLKRMGPETA
jgi:hypothetical protein